MGVSSKKFGHAFVWMLGTLGYSIGWTYSPLRVKHPYEGLMEKKDEVLIC